MGGKLQKKCKSFSRLDFITVTIYNKNRTHKNIFEQEAIMKKSVKLLSVLFVLLLAVVVLPVAAFATEETEQMAPAPEAPKQFASAATFAAGSFEDYVDTDAFMAYLVGQMRSCATEIDISSYGIPRSGGYLEQIGYYIIQNYPEMFHFDWFGPYYYSDGVITKISVLYRDFSDTVAEFNTCTNAFEAVVDRLVDGIEGNKYLTDVEKALLLHDRLVAWTEYDLARLENGTMPDISYTAYGILVKQLGVCQGYALAYDYLLEQVGVRCEYVSSELLNHAWNIVYINNKPYHVDTTWDDPTWDVTGQVLHENFLRSTSGIKATGHEVNGVVDYTSTPTDTTYDNYYWQRSTTAFQYVGGWIFYIDNVSQRLNYINSQGAAVAMVDVTATWYAPGNRYWTENFAKLSSDKTTLFYSQPDGIYRYDPSAGTVEKVYSPNLSIGDTFSVFGFKYERGYLICDLSNTPQFDQYTKNNQVKYMFAKEYDDGWQYINGRWYYYVNNMAKTGWFLDSNAWYYFDANGVMQTGWLKSGNTWYYLKASGAMATGWLKLGNTWYYLNSSGAMVTGWLKLGNTWYYFNSSGAMVTGWLMVGRTYYYFNASGAMQTGWVKSGGTWYYMNSSGAMVTGWLKLGNTWYYFHSSGAMYTGWLQLGGKWYAFTDSGAMITGWGYDASGNYYYFNSDGSMVTGRKYIDGYWYTFNSSGVCTNL